jgi:ubiquinol-cytochrome c reductase iron-sulfur subunit
MVKKFDSLPLRQWEAGCSRGRALSLTFQPSERAKAAGAAVADIAPSSLARKSPLRRGKPVWIVSTQSNWRLRLMRCWQIRNRAKSRANSELRNENRSIKPETVVAGIYRIWGCSPSDKFQAGAQMSRLNDWAGFALVTGPI